MRWVVATAIAAVLSVGVAGAATVEELARAVVYLQEHDRLGEKAEIGTGFFVSHESKLFLVTAEHVSKSIDISSVATIGTKDDRPFTFALSELAVGPSALEWFPHPEADIAVLRLIVEKEFIEGHLQNRFLGSDLLAPRDPPPSRSIPYVVLGFPVGLGVRDSFSPLSRETKLSSGYVNLARGDTNSMTTFLVAQDPSVGGYSGAPLFDIGLSYSEPGNLTIRGATLRLLGLRLPAARRSRPSQRYLDGGALVGQRGQLQLCSHVYT